LDPQSDVHESIAAFSALSPGRQRVWRQFVILPSGMTSKQGGPGVLTSQNPFAGDLALRF
jgi:hypothetical protein